MLYIIFLLGIVLGAAAIAVVILIRSRARAFSATAPAESSPLVIAGLIKQGLAHNPEDLDLRFRLLEILYEAGDMDQFLEQARSYREQLLPGLQERWPQICQMGRDLLPDQTLFANVPYVGDSTNSRRRFAELPQSRQALDSLAQAYQRLRKEPDFVQRLDRELARTAGRPTPLQHARVLSRHIGGAQIHFKREDLAADHARLRLHLTGQAWVARELGKKRVLFAALSGDYAVIAAQAAVRMELKAVTYLDPGAESYTQTHYRQLYMLGVDVREVGPEEEIRNMALEGWLQLPEENMLILDMAAGPHPYPAIAADSQTTIGRECQQQLSRRSTGPLRAIFSRGEGHADAIGLVEPFLGDPEVEVCLVSAAGNGQETMPAPDFPSVRREHAWLEATRRITYREIDTRQATDSAELLARTEGIFTSGETACALAAACDTARRLEPADAVLLMYADTGND